MASSAMKDAIEQYLMSKVLKVVGYGFDPDNYVQTVDQYLHDIPREQFPFVVINAAQKDSQRPGEIGTLRELDEWQVHIYYLDITRPGEQWQEGNVRRNVICNALEVAILNDYNLGNLRVPLGDSTNPSLSEYVYSNYFTNILWNSTGQEDYWQLTCELYLILEAAKN